VAVNEVLVANSAVGAIIREGKTEKLLDVLVAGKGEGMQAMDDSIMSYLRKGVVSPMEAYMKAIDKQKFVEFLPEDSPIQQAH
jgi:twitching motility protein PilT